MTVLNLALTVVAVLWLSIRIESAQLNLLILMLCWPAVGAVLAIVVLYWIFSGTSTRGGWWWQKSQQDHIVLTDQVFISMPGDLSDRFVPYQSLQAIYNPYKLDRDVFNSPTQRRVPKPNPNLPLTQ